MKTCFKLLGAIVSFGLSASVFAAEKPASGKMLCAVTNTVSCVSPAGCISGPADVVNLPVFLQFDPSKKTVESARGSGEKRTSAIASVSTSGDVLVMLGADGASAWSATIDKPSGSLTGSVADNGVGYVIFGSCLAL